MPIQISGHLCLIHGITDRNLPFSDVCALAASLRARTGCSLFTPDGELYLDFGSGIAVNALGHSHPKLVETLQRQAGLLWHVSNLYTIPEQETLARYLCELSFADRVFFCNSGTEAIELMIKAARRYHYSIGAASRNRIITLEGAFHGRTLGALAATGQEKYLAGFEPRTTGFDQVCFGDLSALEAAITEQTAGILLEPVQGESGIRPMSDGHLRDIRAICDQHGILLLLDEVQTEIWRTGRFFAYEHAGIMPDILAAAKGLGAGFPIGACLATEKIARTMQPGTHGSTFGGNLLATAVATKVVKIVGEREFLDRVLAASLRLRTQLDDLVQQYPEVFDQVRGRGLLVGLHCVPPIEQVVAVLHELKVLVVPAGNNVLRLVPPLTVSDVEIDQAVERLHRAAKTLNGVASRPGVHV